MPNRRLLVVSLFIVYSFLATLIWWGQQQRTAVLGSQTDLTEAQVIALTNLMRQEQGLPPLHPNILLNQAAMAKAEHMVQHQYWDHYNNNVTPWQFLDEQAYPYTQAGENLAKGFYSSITLVNAWMQSPAHRANMLGQEYEEIGVAILPQVELLGEQTSLIVQLLAKPAPAGSPPTQGNWNGAPPLASIANQKEILSVKPILYIFGSAGLATFLTTIAITLYWDKRPNSYQPSSHYWKG